MADSAINDNSTQCQTRFHFLPSGSLYHWIFSGNVFMAHSAHITLAACAPAEWSRRRNVVGVAVPALVMWTHPRHFLKTSSTWPFEAETHWASSASLRCG